MSTRASLSLAFILLTAACGTYTDRTRTPPSAPPKPPTPEPVVAALPITPHIPMWYERYDFDNLVVKIEPGVADGKNKAVSIDPNDGAHTKPGAQAYERRLQALGQERERLLRENAVLREQARRADANSQARSEFSELQSQLAHLSAQQAAVNSQAQVIGEEHSALLELLGDAAPDKLAQATAE